MELIKIDVPKHLQEMVGADHSMVAPVHVASSSHAKTRFDNGLVYVYEPRRDCYYWVHNHAIYLQPVKRW